MSHFATSTKLHSTHLNFGHLKVNSFTRGIPYSTGNCFPWNLQQKQNIFHKIYGIQFSTEFMENNILVEFRHPLEDEFTLSTPGRPHSTGNLFSTYKFHGIQFSTEFTEIHLYHNGILFSMEFVENSSFSKKSLEFSFPQNSSGIWSSISR